MPSTHGAARGLLEPCAVKVASTVLRGGDPGNGVPLPGSLAVLGDDRPNWRPDGFGYGRWGCQVGIRFPVVKLLDCAADIPALESNPNPFAALVLAQLKTRETRQNPDARCAWKVRLIKSLYERA